MGITSWFCVRVCAFYSTEAAGARVGDIHWCSPHWVSVAVTLQALWSLASQPWASYTLVGCFLLASLSCGSPGGGSQRRSPSPHYPALQPLPRHCGPALAQVSPENFFSLVGRNRTFSNDIWFPALGRWVPSFPSLFFGGLLLSSGIL